MIITRLKVERFKRVKEADLRLSDINVVVGGNNSGKSSVLQGIHFFVIAAVAQRDAGRRTFPQDDLLFCPARDFVTLRHGGGFKNQSNFAYLHITALAPSEEGDGDEAEGGGDDEDPEERRYQIRIYRGRNLGNVGCVRKGDQDLGLHLTDPDRPFSVFVPGLAGIPRAEEFRTEAVIRRGVASGDANLYLRNVLHLIAKRGRIDALKEWVQRLFPDFWIDISFNQKHDLHIKVEASVNGPKGRRFPLELAGTGLLQAIQIFSYVTLFEPSLLLSDEPDAHLHPDNQAVLAAALQSVVERTDTRIVISTHSRHLVDALHDVANLVWMRAGEIREQGQDLKKVSLLMDLGALDGFDRLGAGDVNFLVLTEDADPALLKVVCSASGMDLTQTLFWSYKSSSRLSSALDLAEFVQETAQGTTILIHRDRDFMTDEEVEEIEEKIKNVGAQPLITRGPDVESYFATPEHCAEVLGEDVAEVREWLNQLAQEQHNDLYHSFLRKRDDVKFQLYRGQMDEAPSSQELIGDEIPVSPECRLGKTMLKAIRREIHDRFGQTPSLVVPTAHLRDERLEDLEGLGG